MSSHFAAFGSLAASAAADGAGAVGCGGAAGGDFALSVLLQPTPITTIHASRIRRGCQIWHTGVVKATESELIDRAAAEVDQTLLAWSLALSVTERLRAASRNAAILERLARAATPNR